MVLSAALFMKQETIGKKAKKPKALAIEQTCSGNIDAFEKYFNKFSYNFQIGNGVQRKQK